MDIYKKLKVKTYINAWDAVSAYGSSRMEEETLLAMREAATRFVHIEELQKAVVENDANAIELCKKTKSVLAERNRLCKLNKNTI